MLTNNVFISAVLWILITLAGVLCLYIAMHVTIWIFLAIVGLPVSMKKIFDKPSKFHCKVFNLAYWSCCNVARVRIHASGIEQVPFDKHFMFVSNHRSKFDNMIHSIVLNKTELAFISKPENFKIPIGRHFMVRGCYMPIERNNPREGLKTILRAISLLNNDAVSIGVFPEGTRSKTLEMLDFKPGCFKIAEKTKCPIVVGVTQGTENIHKNYPWKPTHVNFDVIKVLYPQDYEGKTTVEISDMVYDLIKNHIEKGE